MSYLHDFKEALQRNTRLGLESPFFSYEDTRYLTNDFNAQFPYLILNTFGMLEPKDLTGTCIPIHNQLQTVLNDKLGILSYFTIGYVTLNGRDIYHQTEDSLKRLLSDGIDSRSTNLHAWLTLSSMEIIDMTLPTSYGAINNKNEMLGLDITKHYSELKGDMSYHPMIIGTEYLEKSVWKN
jgi:hypothetical protein